MKTKLPILSIIASIAILIASCENAYMNPTPGEDNLSIFNEYASISIEKYGLADVKRVDLVSLADSIRPFITDDLSKEELYDYMYIITQRMREGHTLLTAPDIGKNPFFVYEYYLGYPKAFDWLMADTLYYIVTDNPNRQELKPEGSIFSIYYGLLPQDSNLGYIRLSSFSVNVDNEDIETMLDYLKDTKGLIIDVRSNLGGFVEFAARLTSYFTAHEYVFATNYVKNGPGPDDFVGSELKITPSGSPLTYTKPIMLLQDRITFSSGSLFSVMMSYLDHVTTVGQRFGGGTGEIIDGILSNGWSYQLSSSNLVDWKGRPTDDGIDADIPMVLDTLDNARDEVIERAILEINSK